ncbi:hypothetical protein [Luteimonas kalidii]|uniref:DUF2884 family protein n=1 Tax=Luteimonas kalidii TaxID=3042025 RepID=A0ABT6JSY0_9GAMM|nr:hypothetical protein [Luteimonas kalidii]MDH5833799.1 hypothetical protein [Luteimonas kalidii]
MKAIGTLALLIALPLVAACGREPDPDPAASGSADAAAAAPAPTTALGRTVARALDEARQELREGDLSLNGDYDVRVNGRRVHRKTDDLPPASITPEGELRVSGNAVAMDDAARTLARDYRDAMLDVAEAGMDLGVRGADLGMKAAGDAIGSLLRGDTEQMEQRIEAEAAQLEVAAMQLCDLLPRLLATQEALAAAVPEFEPYARMDAGDIDDCRDGDHDGTATATATATAQDSPDGELDAAAEADAAAASARDDAAADAASRAAATADPTR